MSRMIAYVSPGPADVPAALGDDVLTSFAALSRVHADGWGAGWRTSAGVGAPANSSEERTRQVIANNQKRIDKIMRKYR